MDDEWHKECKANWEALAAKLVADGFERRDCPSSIIPATFHRGDKVLYLARQLGSNDWYAAPIAPRTQLSDSA